MVRESLRLPWLPAYAILKFQSAFARRVGQRFYFAVIKKSTAIENRLINIPGQQTLGDGFANLLRRSTIGGMFALAAERFLRCAGRDQGLARLVVDDLGVDMFAGKINAEPRTFRGPGHLASDAVVNSPANDVSIDRSHDYS